MAAPARRGDSRGFTLLELLVALAIAGTAIVAVMGALRSAVDTLAASGRYARAVVIARSRLAEVAGEASPAPGERSGDEWVGDARYAWRMAIRKLRQPHGRGSRGRSLLRPLAVDVDVYWREGAGRGHVSAATIVLAPIRRRS